MKTYHDNVAVEILTDIDITLHDGVEGRDVDASRFETEDGRLEESFWGPEPLVTDGDDLAIGKFVGLLEAGALGCSLNFLLEIKRNVAELLFDVTDNFSLGSRGESVATLSEDLHQVVGQVAASHVNTGDSVGKSETLVDGNDVGNAIARVEYDTSGTTGSVEREHSLDGDIEGGSVEGLEDDLSHLLSVRLGVDGRFGKENWVLFRGNAQLVVEGVMPNLLHVIPVGDNAVLDWVSQGEDATLRLCLISDVRVLLTHTNHDAMMTRSSDDGSCASISIAVWMEIGLLAE